MCRIWTERRVVWQRWHRWLRRFVGSRRWTTGVCGRLEQWLARYNHCDTVDAVIMRSTWYLVRPNPIQSNPIQSNEYNGSRPRASISVFLKNKIQKTQINSNWNYFTHTPLTCSDENIKHTLETRGCNTNPQQGGCSLILDLRLGSKLWKLGDIFRENSRKVITPTRYLPWKCSIQ